MTNNIYYNIVNLSVPESRAVKNVMFNIERTVDVKFIESIDPIITRNISKADLPNGTLGLHSYHVVFDEDLNLLTNKGFHVILHEIGHGLGLDHYNSNDQVSIMHPYVGDSNTVAVWYNERELSALIDTFGITEVALSEPTQGDDTLILTGFGDTINGYRGNDYINGLVGDDSIRGGKGDDYLRGAKGDDLLMGDRGNDVLRGDLGSDTLIGGSGSDTFYASSSDTIVDFNYLEDILIWV